MQQSLSHQQMADRWQWEAAFARRLKFPFDGAAGITNNYAQAFQDIFVLSALDGLKNGRYLEIGAHNPVSNNNTYLLAREFGWSGVSIDIDPVHEPDWKKARPKNRLVIDDALTIDYGKALANWFRPKPSWWRKILGQAIESPSDEVGRIDYLQLDIEPSINTLVVLKALPLDSFRFSVITFETDAYAGDLRARDESRELLSARGYELVAANISVLYPPISLEPIPFEDWWVDPQVVSMQIIQAMRTACEASGGLLLPQMLLFSDQDCGEQCSCL